MPGVTEGFVGLSAMPPPGTLLCTAKWHFLHDVHGVYGGSIWSWELNENICCWWQCGDVGDDCDDAD